MQRAPDSSHSKYRHAYPVVRIDTPLDHTNAEHKITVVKVLSSQEGAEAEVSRLNDINADKGFAFIDLATLPEGSFE